MRVTLFQGQGDTSVITLRTPYLYSETVRLFFFSTLKNELVLGNVFKSREEARSEIFDYIEVFYNRKRIHQTLGYKTPEMIERNVAQLTRPLNRG